MGNWKIETGPVNGWKLSILLGYFLREYDLDFRFSSIEFQSLATLKRILNSS